MNAAALTTNKATIALIIMEHGSEWPSHVTGAPECVVIKQGPDESPGELLRHAYERIRFIERSGGAIGTAVLSCCNDTGFGALEARVPIARALLAAVLHRANGTLELVAPSDAHPRVRQSLAGLAETLNEAGAGTSASVSARFVETPIAPASSPRLRRTSAQKFRDRRAAA